MKGREPVRPLERRAIDDLWRNTLAQVRTCFGRLAYLSSLRDGNTGVYQHHGLAFVFGEEEANKALFESHLRTFGDWLNLSLEDQKVDLDQYLAELQDERAKVVENWLRLKPYITFLPATAKPGEKELYMTDLAILLELLRTECGVASPDPDA
jgi:hypothetical protein